MHIGEVKILFLNVTDFTVRGLNNFDISIFFWNAKSHWKQDYASGKNFNVKTFDYLEYR